MGILGDILGAATSIFGDDQAADAAEDASKRSIQFQRDALNTGIALQRPQLEVGNSALSVLASIYGLQQPSAINFNNLGGSTVNGYASDRPATGAEVTQLYQEILGRDPDAGGLNYYLSNGFTPAQIAEAHRGSQEYQQLAAAGRLPDSETGAATQTAQAGVPANLNALITNNPAFQFRQSQGEEAIARAAAARGLNQSGGTLKDLTSFNNDLAGASFQNDLINPLFQLAGFGPQAAGNIQNSASTFAANAGNATIGAGNARATAYQNTGNTIGNLLSSPGFSNLLTSVPGFGG